MLIIISLIACLILFLLVVVFVLSPQTFASAIQCKPLKDVPADAAEFVTKCHSK